MPSGLDMGHDRAPNEAEAAELSSSSISSPPGSPHNLSDTIQVVHSSHSHPTFSSGGGVAIPGSAPQPHSMQLAAATTKPNPATYSTNSSISTSHADVNGGSGPDKIKKPRKKKEVALGADGKPVAVEVKIKKPRKPRESKPKAAAAATTSTTTTAAASAAPRKRVKTEPKADETIASAVPRQPTITEMVGGLQHHPPPSASTTLPTQQQQHTTESATVRSSLPPPSNPTMSRPFSSGQNYDPIRGSTMNAPPPPHSNGIQQQQQQRPASPHVNRASASPSIASLIDPPAVSRTMPYSPQTSGLQTTASLHQQPSPTPKPKVPSFSPYASQPQSPIRPSFAALSADDPMDTDTSLPLPNRQVPEIKAPSKSSSPAPTPKAARPTPEPPKGTGSGLLSSSDLFGGPSSAETSERRGVNIDLQIPLKRAGGNTVNIAQEIIKKYGRDAVNPRAAAHREQLLRIAAEQERLGGASNDDMSVDLMSEMEGDSNVEMGGMDDEKSNTGGDNAVDTGASGKVVRKRKKKVEDYDKDDDFIDDTELAWQQQAAVAKDGFFVYSGPLVPEGQAPQVETSAPTRGGRGRGRGRGGRGGAAGTTHASLADKTATPAAAAAGTVGPRGGRGRGRGTGAPRKPRITKADKEKMESEKAERERSAAGMTATASNHHANGTAQMRVSSPAAPLLGHNQQPSAPTTFPQSGHAMQALGGVV